MTTGLRKKKRKKKWSKGQYFEWFKVNFHSFLQKSEYLKDKVNEIDTILSWKWPILSFFKKITNTIVGKLYQFLPNFTHPLGNNEMLLIGSLNLFLLNKLNYMYASVLKTADQERIPVDLVLDLLKWIEGKKDGWNRWELAPLNTIEQEIRQEFELDSLTTWIEEWLEIQFFSQGSFEEFLKPGLPEETKFIVENRLKRGLRRLLKKPSIDLESVSSALKRQLFPSIVLIVFHFKVKEKKKKALTKQFREELVQKLGFWTEGGINFVFKQFSATESFRTVLGKYATLKQDIQNCEVLENARIEEIGYYVQVNLITPGHLELILNGKISQSFRIHNIKEKAMEFIQKNGKVSFNAILNEIDSYNEYFGEGVTKETVVNHYRLKHPSPDDGEILIENLALLDWAEIADIFNITENRARDLLEEIKFNASIIQGLLTSDIGAVPVVDPRARFQPKTKRIIKKIEQAFGSEVSDKFVDKLDLVVKYKDWVEKEDWKNCKDFTREVDDFQPHIKRFITDYSREKSVSEQKVGRGNLEYQIGELFFEFKFVSKNEKQKTPQELFELHRGQVNQQMTDLGLTYGFLVTLDVRDQKNKSYSDFSNYFTPHIIKGGKNVIPKEDGAPRYVVSIVVFGGEKTVTSKLKK